MQLGEHYSIAGVFLTVFAGTVLQNTMARRAGPRKQVCTMTNGLPAESNRRKSRHASPRKVSGSSWVSIPATFRTADRSLPQPWEDIFGPLRHGTIDDLVLVGQCGQSIDARTATPSGHSHYINGEVALAHLHRLRSLVDAVVIGVGTAIADDPQLTVRRVEGPSPARVIIDPKGRLPSRARALAADGIRRLVITLAETPTKLTSDIEVVPLMAHDGQLAPRSIIAALAARGFRRILIEGGADTVSRFLAGRCLDRLHVMVAPIILGAGPSSLTLAPVERIEQAIRAPVRTHVLGGDLLLDCDLRAHRAPIGWANMST
jgi:diaminohydroxyphosphoribosylaminopyrimidine deaminase / 5-amino-6-(5-phosphoribosylamino)uracil reductase